MTTRSAAGALVACALLAGGCGAGSDTEVASVSFRPYDAGGSRVVLATGDSMIQTLDYYLERRLERRRRIRVVSDDHISTGISKPSVLNWPRYARAQARRYRPRATVIFLGANEGFDFPGRRGRSIRCCGRAWRIQYSRRVQKMMRTYRRRGRGRVYWLLLPQARSGPFRRVYPAVNRALIRAARRVRRRVRLVRLNRVFTPRGRYRSHMRWHGRLVQVRKSDGIHLTNAGASIAAYVVIRAMRRDRFP